MEDGAVDVPRFWVRGKMGKMEKVAVSNGASRGAKCCLFFSL